MGEQRSVRSRSGGPLLVSGDVPLVRKNAVHSEHGEPLAWQTSDELDTGERDTYVLCRCGDSANKPLCDGSHVAAGFEGDDTADISTYDERSKELGGSGITVRAAIADGPLWVTGGIPVTTADGVELEVRSRVTTPG
jgi:CDGSH-type Zn-finger protein